MDGENTSLYPSSAVMLEALTVLITHLVTMLKYWQERSYQHLMVGSVWRKSIR